MIHIEFCERWNYKPYFDRVSKVLKNINPNLLIEGNNQTPRSGAFEVKKDGQIMFSKLKSGRFPNNSEIKSWI